MDVRRSHSPWVGTQSLSPIVIVNNQAQRFKDFGRQFSPENPSRMTRLGRSAVSVNPVPRGPIPTLSPIACFQPPLVRWGMASFRRIKSAAKSELCAEAHRQRDSEFALSQQTRRWDLGNLYVVFPLMKGAARTARNPPCPVPTRVGHCKILSPQRPIVTITMVLTVSPRLGNKSCKC